MSETIRDNLVWLETETREGNTLQLFYNRESNLVVLDIVARNERGGNEIARMKLDERKLLEHTKR